MRDRMNPPQPLDIVSLINYDWREAFKFADKPTHVIPARRSEAPEPGFELFHVREIYHAVEGENDGADWVCLGQLRDGRWFVLNAGCDYTGWDCRSSGDAAIADTYEEAVRLGLTDEQRERLGIKLDIAVSA